MSHVLCIILDSKMRKFIDYFKMRYLKESLNRHLSELNNHAFIEMPPLLIIWLYTRKAKHKVISKL